MVWTQRRSEGGGIDRPKGLVAHFNADNKGFKVSRFFSCHLFGNGNSIKSIGQSLYLLSNP
jgi:hypothetical protein